MFADVDLTVGRGRVRRGARPQRRGQVDADAGDPRAGRARRGLGDACSARPPAQARPEIGYLPAAPRLRLARPGSAAIDLVRLGLDGARWGLPIAAHRRARDAAGAPSAQRVEEVIELVGASAYAAPRDRRAVRRRAAAAADRPGAGAPPAAADPRRAARQPRPAQPGRRRRARAARSARPRASRCCSSPTTSTRCSATWTR